MKQGTVVFIDDEASTLRALRRSLRGHTSEWSFVFESSPIRALQIIKEQGPSIVVCDKRMPEMDGEKLLRAVQESVPEAMRILISGDTSDNTVLASADVAHLLLPKPFDAEELVEVLERAKALKQVPISDAQRKLIGSLQHLPALPLVYAELKKYLGCSDEPEINKLVEIIECDLAISAKVIQVANSSFFGFQTKTESLQQALMRLGIGLVESLVLFFGICKQEPKHFDANRAQTVVNILQDFNVSTASDYTQDQVYLAGLFHDIGSLVDIGDASHGDAIGAYLLKLWGFAPEVVNAVLYQSNPLKQMPVSKLTCQLFVAKQLAAGDISLDELSEEILDCAEITVKESTE
ncbi:HDOD domain-containing protein [Neptuniibacter sp. QD34_54]|uniref:HDOD domain-containing protein n=1 Tax=Neptuniibacter sp. QD34_54 TaxID=3398208 RepID=UPI0039F49E5D